MTVAAAVAAGAAVLLLSACLPVHAAGVKGTEVAPAVEHGGAAHDCFWTSPEGNHYDLTSLSHHVYQYPSSRVLSRSPGVFEYTMAVCQNAKHVPAKCEHIKDTHPSPAYQVASGWCFYLGDLKQAVWNQLSPHNPKLGVELTYKGGQPCSDGRPREIRYHFVCAPHWSADEHPLIVHETPERCHYNVTWPSRHACPTISYTNPHTWGVFDFLYYILMLFSIYLVLGCCINVSRDDVPIGWAAMPNRDWWEGHITRCCPAGVVRRLGIGGDPGADIDVRFGEYPMRADRRA